jgi:hypothetical protein
LLSNDNIREDDMAKLARDVMTQDGLLLARHRWIGREDDG